MAAAPARALARDLVHVRRREDGAARLREELRRVEVDEVVLDAARGDQGLAAQARAVAGVHEDDDAARAHLVVEHLLKLGHRERGRGHVGDLRVVHDEVEILRRVWVWAAVPGEEDEDEVVRARFGEKVVEGVAHRADRGPLVFEVDDVAGREAAALRLL